MKERGLEMIRNPYAQRWDARTSLARAPLPHHPDDPDFDPTKGTFFPITEEEKKQHSVSEPQWKKEKARIASILDRKFDDPGERPKDNFATPKYGAANPIYDTGVGSRPTSGTLMDDFEELDTSGTRVSQTEGGETMREKGVSTADPSYKQDVFSGVPGSITPKLDWPPEGTTRESIEQNKAEIRAAQAGQGTENET